MTKSLMIQGTGSGAGKSLLTAAFCRILNDEGLRVAPFKAQNMALNSAISAEGGEIGRAQALQARAARIDCTGDMNPILLKVAGESGSQVIINGRVHATMKARDYYAFRDQAWRYVAESYDRLARSYDAIVIEGAGSPAEINLMDVDIVNMAMARYAKAPVLLVGDIDKGGVFASLYGTVKLVGRDSRFIKGFIINKFRGDKTILDPGLAMIQAKTGRPVIGVLPYVHTGLPEEDGLALGTKGHPFRPFEQTQPIRIVVVRLRSISNFNDFDPLRFEPGVELVFSDDPSTIAHADMVIIPGSKNTVKDLLLARQNGVADAIQTAHRTGTQIVGICGGYQMLGRRILDPLHVESDHAEIDGLGLLDIETTFGAQKTTCRVEAQSVNGAPGTLNGYEIHMGDSSGDVGLFRFRRISPGVGTRELLDGSRKANCWGTYLHGIFDNDAYRHGLLNELRQRKGMPPSDCACSYDDHLDRAIDALANVVREHCDIAFVRKAIGL